MLLSPLEQQVRATSKASLLLGFKKKAAKEGSPLKRYRKALRVAVVAATLGANPSRPRACPFSSSAFLFFFFFKQRETRQSGLFPQQQKPAALPASAALEENSKGKTVNDELQRHHHITVITGGSSTFGPDLQAQREPGPPLHVPKGCIVHCACCMSGGALLLTNGSCKHSTTRE